jgi:hypothetical protein
MFGFGKPVVDIGAGAGELERPEDLSSRIEINARRPPA